MHGLCGVCSSVQTENNVAVRHGVDIDHDLFPSDGIALRHPALAAVVYFSVGRRLLFAYREVIADILLIESRDRIHGRPLRVAAGILRTRISCPIIILAGIINGPISTTLIMMIKIDPFVASVSKRNIVPVITVAVALRIGVLLILEFQRVLVAVKVYIDDRGAVRLNLFGLAGLSIYLCVLVVGFIVESDADRIGSRGIGLGAVLSSGDGDGVAAHADGAGGNKGIGVLDVDGFDEVIDLAVRVAALHVLFPDNDGIVGFQLRDPARVQRLPFRQRVFEYECRAA